MQHVEGNILGTFVIQGQSYQLLWIPTPTCIILIRNLPLFNITNCLHFLQLQPNYHYHVAVNFLSVIAIHSNTIQSKDTIEVLLTQMFSLSGFLKFPCAYPDSLAGFLYIMLSRKAVYLALWFIRRLDSLFGWVDCLFCFLRVQFVCQVL